MKLCDLKKSHDALSPGNLQPWCAERYGMEVVLLCWGCKVLRVAGGKLRAIFLRLAGRVAHNWRFRPRGRGTRELQSIPSSQRQSCRPPQFKDNRCKAREVPKMGET